MSEIKYITVQGAREHNLKGVDVTLPRNKFIVFTGLSGSGKSSRNLCLRMRDSSWARRRNRTWIR